MSVWRRPRVHPLAASGAFARQRWPNYGECAGTPAQVPWIDPSADSTRVRMTHAGWWSSAPAAW